MDSLWGQALSSEDSKGIEGSCTGAQNSSTCEQVPKSRWTVTPRIFMDETRSRPASGGGRITPRRRTMNISFDLDVLRCRLLRSAQADTCSSSSHTVDLMREPTIKYVSSAYLTILFSEWTGCRSEALMTNSAGPTPEPWTTLALMLTSADVLLWNLVTCFRSLRKFISQLYMLSGISRQESFAARVACRTVSKAFEKSRDMKVT